MSKKALIAILASVAAVVIMAIFVVPRYVAYVSHQSQQINATKEASEQGEAAQAQAIGRLRIVATAAYTYRNEKNTFPSGESDLVASGLVADDFFSPYGYSIDYARYGKHFVSFAEVEGKDLCIDESQVVRAGEITEAHRCVGPEVK